jgi:hypothetical protein
MPAPRAQRLAPEGNAGRAPPTAPAIEGEQPNSLCGTVTVPKAIDDDLAHSFLMPRARASLPDAYFMPTSGREKTRTRRASLVTH